MNLKTGNIGKIILIFAVNIVLFSTLFYLRMIPSIGTTVEFNYDCALNYRLTQDLINKGYIPVRDHLSTYPEGREIRTYLPTGMYYTFGLFFKTLNYFDKISLDRAILVFCSFFGSLIFIPIYFLSYELYHNKIVASTSALLAGIIPAYLQRTSCYLYRNEVVGAPFMFASLLFFVKAFAANDNKKAILYSSFSVAFLVFALIMWRLAILFLFTYLLVFIFLWIFSKNTPKGSWVIFFIILSTFAFLPFIPGSGGNMGAYGSFPKAALEITKHRLGIGHEFSDFTRIIYTVTEMRGMSLLDIIGKKYLSFSFLFVLFYFLAYFSKRKVAKDNILFIFLIIFLVITLMFIRNRILLGPLAALTLGEAAMHAFKPRRWLKAALICLIAVVLIKTGYDSYGLITTRGVHTKIDRFLKEAITVINERIPKDTVILSGWSDGYIIQTYSDRPTTTDALFESPAIIDRILAFSKICYSYDEHKLWEFCKKYSVTHVLVAKHSLWAISDVAGVNYHDYFSSQGPRILGGPVIYKLTYTPQECRQFEFLFENNEYVLHRVR